MSWTRFISEIAKELDSIKFQYGIQLASKYTSDIQSVLDVGCGTGHSLDIYERCGVPDVHGIDPGIYSNMSDDKRISASFMVEVPQTFSNISLITLWDTLEHIHDFKFMLNSVYKALGKNGLCLIMVPNFLSLATRLMRELSPVFQIDHLHYFSETSFGSTLLDCGFSVVHKETVISEIDNCETISNSKNLTSLLLAVTRRLIGTSQYIHQNMLGSRLLFIGKKN